MSALQRSRIQLSLKALLLLMLLVSAYLAGWAPQERKYKTLQVKLEKSQSRIEQLQVRVTQQLILLNHWRPQKSNVITVTKKGTVTKAVTRKFPPALPKSHLRFQVGIEEGMKLDALQRQGVDPPG